MPQIALENVSVHLPVYNARGRDLKSTILGRAVGGRVDGGLDRSVTIVRALDGITLSLTDGDRVGLVGHNGAGKTTLLRVLAGIYPATSGTVSITGRVSALTDLMMGMDLEATGYENIFLRAIVMGLTRGEARAIKEEVAAFTELGEYLDLPIRTYSSGMLLRLAFAISTAVQPEIIILDEMIGAGDSSFISKARHRIENLINRASILVLATHDDGLIRQMCNKCVWMRDGRVASFGPLDAVLSLRDGSGTVPSE